MRHNSRLRRGFSLLEVTISSAVLALGTVGLVAIQVRTDRNESIGVVRIGLASEALRCVSKVAERGYGSLVALDTRLRDSRTNSTPPLGTNGYCVQLYSATPAPAPGSGCPNTLFAPQMVDVTWNEVTATAAEAVPNNGGAIKQLAEGKRFVADVFLINTSGSPGATPIFQLNQPPWDDMANVATASPVPNIPYDSINYASLKVICRVRYADYATDDAANTVYAVQSAYVLQ